jgi:hypothetical protein
MIPTWGRKVRVALDWAGALLGRRDLSAPTLTGDAGFAYDAPRQWTGARA